VLNVLRGKGDLVVTVLFLLLFAWALYQAFQWPPRTRLFPLAITIPMLVLLAIKLGRDLWYLRRHQPLPLDAPDPDESPVEQADVARASWRDTGQAAGWLLGFFAAVWAFGLLWTVPVYTFIYLKLPSRESWIVAGLGAVGAWAFTWVVFDQLLHLPLPAGALIPELE
jgi:hypothetical protein